MTAMPNTARHDWALRLYRYSVLKQQKYRRLITAMPEVQGKRCLDLGGDNGVISLLLRALGGIWHSADIEAHAVAAIRELVSDNVVQLEDSRLPFADRYFDLVVIVDMLEHVEDDRALVCEVARVTKPGGHLIVNVPHVKRWSLIRPLKRAAGLTDEAHGHLRPGYTGPALQSLLRPYFEVEEARTYSRFFSELVDLLLHVGYSLRSKGAASKKGTIVTEDDLRRRRAEMRLLQWGYPLLKMVAACDALLFWQQGHKLVLRAAKV